MLNHKEKDIVLSALDIVIDGVSSSEANEEMRTAGVYSWLNYRRYKRHA